jgi:hypothetical protein
MKETTFEDTLKEIHGSLFPTLLDDDMSDHFNDWLGTIDGEEYIRFAEIHGKEQFIRGMKHAQSILG